jgi:hypothetical protein
MMTKYKNDQAVDLHFPSLSLFVKAGEEFETEADLTTLTGIVVVEDKKTSKKDVSDSTEA